jgi:hypothetical protein
MSSLEIENKVFRDLYGSVELLILRRKKIGLWVCTLLSSLTVMLMLELSKDASFLHTTILTMCTAKKQI